MNITEICPAQLLDFTLINNQNSSNVWCCDASENFLRFNFTPNNTSGGTATVYILDMNFNTVATYANWGGGLDVGFPNGINISNQNPPPCGTYFLKIVNDCDTTNVIGGVIEVVNCMSAKNIKNSIKSESSIQMEVFPNPISNNLNIRMVSTQTNIKNENSKISFRLIDANFSRQIGLWRYESGKQFSLNMSNIPKGSYILIATIDGINISKKIVKL